MNDSFRTNSFVRFHPETIAAACIYLAARVLKVPLPNHGTPWFLLITHTTLPEIRDICREILRLYQRAKPNSEKLEKTVSLLKKAQQEAKLKLKGNLGGGTPNTQNSSRPGTPSKVSPYSGAEDQKQKGDQLINGLKRKLKERNRSRSRSADSRSPHRKQGRGRPLPKHYSRDRSRSNGRHRDGHKSSKSKSRKRSRSPRSRSRSYERGTKKYRSRSRSRQRHRNTNRRSRSRSRDRYRR